MKISLKGKTAIITGATRGLGKAMADLFIAHDCRVICTGTKPKNPLKNSLMEYWALDLSNDKSIKSFSVRLKKLSKIDILINNAGINKIESIDKIDQKDWDRILKVNLTGAMILLRDVSAHMIRTQAKGKIVNVSSIFGIVSKAKRNAYSASKTGLIGLTHSAALDLAPYDILVNALCPGFVLTDMTKSILSLKDRKALSAQVPFGRFGTEEEIAKAALFLCSDLNTYMTGQALVVDGGYTCK